MSIQGFEDPLSKYRRLTEWEKRVRVMPRKVTPEAARDAVRRATDRSASGVGPYGDWQCPHCGCKGC